MVAASRIRLAGVGPGSPPGYPAMLADRDSQVEYGGADADHQLPAGRIDDLQLATPVGVHVNAAVP
jgi:hypothetical protein